MKGATPTGVLVLAYGTPETLDDVEPYYTHIRGGRTPAPHLVADLRERYEKVGGQTPLYRLTKSVADQLAERLEADRPGEYRVYLGMKHWHPFIEEAVSEILADGVREVIGVVLAPHYSRYSLEGYRTYTLDALQKHDDAFRFHFVERWHDEPLFRELIARRIAEGLRQFPEEMRSEARVVFSAHSLPEKIVALGDPYVDELRDSAAGIAEIAGLEQYGFCYQSEAPTPEPWLGPDIVDYLEALHGEGVRAVLSVPFGFVADHLEVLWDIDTEAQAKAGELGMTLRRIRMPNDDADFVEAIEAVVLQADRARAGAA
ncbi:MAG TPA: ferrochelatase [Longimicrobiaceae bacterium]|nr:ferrochelatase [Longimicrobiaceae bacterium]